MSATQANSLRGKVAFVTGGSRGIGAGIVRRLASDGASVAFTYSNSEEKALHLVREIESSAGSALALKADSAYAEELQSAVIKATEFFGPLDIFVSNAGILRRGTIDTYGLEDFDRMVAINIRAAFIGIQAAARKMKDGGRIILIGSNTAIRTAFPGASIYSMTKAALTGLVRGAAIDLVPAGHHGQKCSTRTDGHGYDLSSCREDYAAHPSEANGRDIGDSQLCFLSRVGRSRLHNRSQSYHRRRLRRVIESEFYPEWLGRRSSIRIRHFGKRYAFFVSKALPRRPPMN